MSDLAQTLSCDRLPQRIAARTERSSFHLLDERLESPIELLLDWLLNQGAPPERGVRESHAIINERTLDCA